MSGPTMVAACAGAAAGYTMTAGTENEGSYNLTGGGISPGSFGAATSMALYDTSTGNSIFSAVFASNPGSTWLASVTANGKTKDGSSATFSYTGTTAQWLWGGSTFGFVSGAKYTIKLVA